MLEDEVSARIEKLKKLVELGENPYKKTKFEVTCNTEDIKRSHKDLAPGEETDSKCKIAGRLMTKRVHGGISFSDLHDRNGKIQLVFRENELGERYNLFLDLIDTGDIVGVSGNVIKTKRGELSILVRDFDLLSKCLRPLPEKWHGLKDVEARYRQRYLDFMMNPEARRAFTKMHKIKSEMRRELDDRGFIEIKTPVLQPIYGGAFALPFKTYHNFLEQDMYLRIAPELYLKRLIVGGFEKVYEFATCFRNESIDSTHNPEFEQIEIYEAYANYEDMMKLTEEIIYRSVKETNGGGKIEYQGNEINLKPPWKRIRLDEAVKRFAGIDVSEMEYGELVKIAEENNIDKRRRGEIIEELFELHAQKRMIQPTFIVDFPVDISPLAKKDVGYAQRFEGYIGGLEVCNGYTELNDPIEQYERFKEEEEIRRKIKELEYMPMDKDFVVSLEYGMPPTGGVGIGMARLFSLVLDKPSIKEIIAFPAMAKKDEGVKPIAEIFPDLLKGM